MKGAKDIISRYRQDREGTLPCSVKEKIENSKKPNNVKNNPPPHQTPEWAQRSTRKEHAQKVGTGTIEMERVPIPFQGSMTLSGDLLEMTGKVTSDKGSAVFPE
ncbi:hypothetical protein MRB53_014174 [Persea americana]|uniref:Uncharacterized protein n=1 Tax=Persea americana TaxID=3435 RepID=A0ACC2KAA4_PERAE|nr:hypothetical protein MRB53_014174 [Persea americana]